MIHLKEDIVGCKPGDCFAHIINLQHCVLADYISAAEHSSTTAAREEPREVTRSRAVTIGGACGDFFILLFRNH